MEGGAAIRVGAIAGIPLRVHFSWLVALFLVTSSLSAELRASAGAAAPLVALATALCLFAALVAHELGHSLVARRAGVGVRSITLFVFGGVASLEDEPRRARDELAIALAGPVVSVVIGVSALLLARAGLPPIVAAPLGWLGRINIGIAIFNMLPGFPLDGGRVLRAALWAAKGDGLWATLGAARVGRGIAYGIVALGVLGAALGGIADGLWTALVGWFLLSASRAAATDARVRAALGGVVVGQVMTAELPLVGRLAGDPRVPSFDWRTPMLEALRAMGDAPLALVTDGARVVGVAERAQLAAIVSMELEREAESRRGGTRWSTMRGAHYG